MDNDLYQDQIVEWSKKTDHINNLEKADCSGIASNPLCGDRVSVELEVDGDVIKSMSCRVKGCMLCRASGSILAEQARGMKFHELKNVGSQLEIALKSPADNSEPFPERYGMFLPVRSHKSRHSCVLLPFQALIQAVSEYRERACKEDTED